MSGDADFAPFVIGSCSSGLIFCRNGGECIEGICQCPIGFQGDACENDVRAEILIGCLLGAVSVCLLVIVAFIIYQRRQDATPQIRRVISVRNRNISKTVRSSALADVEIPPDYDEAVAYEQDQCFSAPSLNSNKNQPKSEIINENSTCIQLSDQEINSQAATSKDCKVKPSMSFASRLLERALGTRQNNTEPQRRRSPRRSNSTPSAKHDFRPSPPKKEVETKRVRGPTRAISVPGKVVQVNME
ncbi:uncharacterized protein LOC117108622 [Anneissia japonica]|uniref:uncharacterized protein LOC117108622 n=1 Tax=Anneissia japonica TaxID=1529436 RepID=UPI0014255711|nr:uncharacterized protein LOC117108622 [Anneissia japonica]XP_033106598.1 uncharacterized protein LOC117108622 [Anneissia japonica]XP_033106599.1 uncharacterized protein LOC117108622 [Anneissia japonica]XP_033106600.1 uncharacterized protein LOC117108622 [Anneissia japonica]